MTKTSNRIEIKSEIFEWAIEESQKDINEIRIRFNKFDKWISQIEYPTYRQVEDLANFLKVPFGYMFLDEPPSKDVIESQFRTIGNKKPKISKNLKDTIYSMSRKQDWISEFRKDNGWESIIPDEYKNLDTSKTVEFAQKVKSFIGLKEYWYKEVKDINSAFIFLRKLLEEKGIIVMQSGIVGPSTKRLLQIEEFRGFMLYDQYAPLIFLHANDSYAGKIFTLIHELIHIILEEDDVFDSYDFNSQNSIEAQINKIAIEFLVPDSHLSEYLENQNTDIDEENIIELSSLFKVNRLALAYKLLNQNLIEQELLDKIILETEISVKTKSKKVEGSHFWNTYKSRYSNTFIKTVIKGAESGYVPYTYAFKLLDLSARSYDVLKGEFQ